VTVEADRAGVAEVGSSSCGGVSGLVVTIVATGAASEAESVQAVNAIRSIARSAIGTSLNRTCIEILRGGRALSQSKLRVWCRAVTQNFSGFDSGWVLRHHHGFRSSQRNYPRRHDARGERQRRSRQDLDREVILTKPWSRCEGKPTKVGPGGEWLRQRELVAEGGHA